MTRTLTIVAGVSAAMLVLTMVAFSSRMSPQQPNQQKFWIESDDAIILKGAQTEIIPMIKNLANSTGPMRKLLQQMQANT